MKGTIIFTLFLFVCNSLSAQNLVPNSDFELVKAVECLYSTPDNKFDKDISDWYTPTIGSTDLWFYDSLANKNCTQNLSNLEIHPHSGRICLGLYTYSQIQPNYREYAQVKLKQPLTKGKSYLASFYVLLNKNISRIATNNLGMAFTKTAIGVSDLRVGPALLINNQAQVVERSIINSTKEWVKIQSCFIAKDSLRYLTIGNFYSDTETIFSYIGDVKSPDGYYLIDDVTVQELSYSIPLLNLGNDTTLCLNQSVEFKFDTTSYQVQWQDGSNKEIYQIKSTGKYWVKLTKNECILSDTLSVKILPPIHLPNDNLLCNGESITLNPNYSFNSIIWSDGSKDSTLSINQAGIYWVKVNSTICNISDTISIQFVDCPGNIPNIITPNNDGLNDTFFIENIEYSNWRLQIFNRWGAQVYDIEPYENKWGGDNLPSGLYYYNLSSSRLNKFFKGWLQIMRQ
ncbi:gliding motility-associated C-terminal domain-containing protein [Spirosoma litoris]